ncbi:hypothetical protein Ancab_015022 [Ancistrocladus abbreviatus]
MGALQTQHRRQHPRPNSACSAATALKPTRPHRIRISKTLNLRRGSSMRSGTRGGSRIRVRVQVLVLLKGRLKAKGVALLKASLDSKTILTEVFLAKDMQLGCDGNERGSDSYDGR